VSTAHGWVDVEKVVFAPPNPTNKQTKYWSTKQQQVVNTLMNVVFAPPNPTNKQTKYWSTKQQQVVNTLLNVAFSPPNPTNNQTNIGHNATLIFKI
jgi:hypothetical protein